MKGIQINNFFNNHISLNGKKINNTKPNIINQPNKPNPIVVNNHLKDQERDNINQYEAHTPQMKPFKKNNTDMSGRQRRTNTNVTNKNKSKQKSKEKKSSSLEQFRKIVSEDKQHQKDSSQQHEISKVLNKTYKKPKISNKNDKEISRVKRSKSAIIKNTQSKGFQSKQTSRQFLKESKRNIINSADNSLKNHLSRKKIKKQTQNLIDAKQLSQRVQCRTARVQSTMVKSRKHKDKILNQLQSSVQRIDSKASKFQTQKKIAATPSTRSYLTSAKQSKPNSARQKKVSKKLFDSKEKYLQKEEYHFNIQNSKDQHNEEMKRTLMELQEALKNVSSKKGLAKQLQKFTSKLDLPAEPQRYNHSSSLSEEQQSNSQAFKRIKKFKNDLQLKKGKEPEQSKNFSSKKSSKKLINKKKKLQNPYNNQEKKNVKKFKNIEIKLPSKIGDKIQFQSPVNNIQQPWPFAYTSQEESKYTKSISDSKNTTERQYRNRQLNENMQDSNRDDDDDEQSSQDRHGFKEQQILDENNKKYMEFLKNLQSEQKQEQKHRNLSKKPCFESPNNLNSENQKSENLIEDINNYLNEKSIPDNFAREYQSQKVQQTNHISRGGNPILERRKMENLSRSPQDIDDFPITHLSDNQQELNDDSYDDKIIQIQKLKQFQKQSDKMMKKIQNKTLSNKQKTLTLQFEQKQENKYFKPSSQILNQRSKSPSSPKYDDRYPHLVKSPKFSDIEITNILAAKEKCLSSKHEKMNELIQKMFQKQLVSPKSYEYSIYQLKKRFEEQADGLQGFKEQASEILNEINKDKNQIKGIDQLIRQERWQQARKLMKMDNRTASLFSGFKKNKQKSYEDYEGWEKVQVAKKQQLNLSPTKKKHIEVVQNNISVTIAPSPLKTIKKVIQAPPKKVPEIINRTVERQIVEVKPASLRQQDESSQKSSGITRQLQFEFDQKFRLKSSQDQNFKSKSPQDLKKLQQQFNAYLDVDKAESQDFEHYVYYESEQNQKIQENNSAVSYHKGKQLKQEGMFKLIQVSTDLARQAHHGEQKEQQDLSYHEQDSSNNEQEHSQDLNANSDSFQQKSSVIEIITNKRSPKQQKVIAIDDTDIGQFNQYQTGFQKREISIIQVPEIMKSHQIVSKDSQKQLQDDQSDSNSLLQYELRKGFESNLFFIKEYCISLCEYIRDNEEKKNDFKANITQPSEFNVSDLLNKYRVNIDGVYDNSYCADTVPLSYHKEFRRPLNKAIPVQLASQFNKTYVSLKFFNLDVTQKGRTKYAMEKEAENIFLSAILEVLNESLDFERPGSIFGKPLPWASNSKYLKNMKYLNSEKKRKVVEQSEQSAETYDFIFGVAIARIIQWGSCLCGFLPDTAQLQNTQIDDEYVIHIRQTRMAFLLQKLLAQQQATINNAELQQAEVLLYLGKQIMEQLFKEYAAQMCDLKCSNLVRD